jgi:hypothetical protein
LIIADSSESSMMSGNKEHRGSEPPPGQTASFPYDRMTIERFRKAFPRARWNEDVKAWFVPGKTAARRFDRWIERESAEADVYADMKGRDAYAFEPIVSKYLRPCQDWLEVVTPYSRTVVEQMRNIAFASWDADRRLWIVPYRSYEQLRTRWDLIEEAARRNEPEERQRRRLADRGSVKDQIARARATERRRRRYPLDPDDLPPLGQPVMTSAYGIVVFVGSDGEMVDPDILRRSYSDISPGGDYVWGCWRLATLDELIRTWPQRSRAQVEPRIWWRPTLEELRVARKTAARRERANRSHPSDTTN